MPNARRMESWPKNTLSAYANPMTRASVTSSVTLVRGDRDRREECDEGRLRDRGVRAMDLIGVTVDETDAPRLRGDLRPALRSARHHRHTTVEVIVSKPARSPGDSCSPQSQRA